MNTEWPDTTRDIVGLARARHDEVCRAFGKQVRDQRMAYGLSIDFAARQAGISWSAWRNIEEGKATTLLTFYKVAEVLAWELFIETEEK